MAPSWRMRLAFLLISSVAMLSDARAQAQDGASGPLPAPNAGSGASPADSATKSALKADPGAVPKAGPTAVGRASIVRLVTTGNPMLWPLALCSIVTLGFALERLVALRRERVIPRDFVNRFLERLSSGKLDRERAVELCRANDSPVARVFAHAIRYWGQPAALIRQAIGHDAAGELADLRRNVRVLNGTATLAPLLGLLGTVIGMIESFDALGVGGRGKGEQLAHGISLALMTTALGLAIAVISVAAYYYLLHQVDSLVRDLDEQTLKVIDLVAGEGTRPVPSDRWTSVVPGDHPRHEPQPQSRTLGRADPVRSDPV
jgi:biopolymer transport protein ExbB